jgi:hypothetical protein
MLEPKELPELPDRSCIMQVGDHANYGAQQKPQEHSNSMLSNLDSNGVFLIDTARVFRGGRVLGQTEEKRLMRGLTWRKCTFARLLMRRKMDICIHHLDIFIHTHCEGSRRR